MLNYRTLDYKPTQYRKDANGKETQCVDLLTKTWTEDAAYEGAVKMIVNEYYVARPDLISLAVYGTDEYGDLICKWNGLSNPFELNEDMVIELPSSEVIHEATSNREHSATELIKDEKTDTIYKSPSSNYAKRTDARSASAPTVGDPPPFVIDKSLGMVLY